MEFKEANFDHPNVIEDSKEFFVMMNQGRLINDLLNDLTKSNLKFINFVANTYYKRIVQMDSMLKIIKMNLPETYEELKDIHNQLKGEMETIKLLTNKDKDEKR